MEKTIFILLIFTTLSTQLFPQTRNLYVEGTGNQLGVIHTTSTGSSIAGIELLRGNAFSATDWRIINDGGTFKLLDGTDNFSTPGDENLRIGTSGTLRLPTGTEASIGDGSGVLVIGEASADNLAIDRNELLARHGTASADLFMQAGLDVGNTIINVTDGHVGIGEAAPPIKLSVDGGTEVRTDGGGYLLIGSIGSANLGLDDNEILARNGVNAADLFIQNGTRVGHTLLNTSDGNVGIGEIAPPIKLTVGKGTEVQTSGGGYALLGTITSSNLALDDNEIMARNGTGAADLFLQAGLNVGNTILNVADGRVGIGESVPSVKLSVANGTDVTPNSGGFALFGTVGSNNVAIDDNEIMARNGVNAADLFMQIGTEGRLSVGADANEVDAKLTVEDDDWQIELINQNDHSNWYIGVSNPNWIVGSDKLVIDDDNSSSNPLLLLDGSAEAVAIGTENIPTGYQLAVDGKIIGEEVRVELTGNWPDYVLEPDYQLSTLEDLEKEISHLGHLPGMPSAAEVELEGFELGNMQKKLLEKVEELTLYLIELKREINQIKKENLDLKRELFR